MSRVTPNGSRTLNRAVRRRLAEPGGQDLTYDLTAAVLEAAIELRGDQDECTVAELNELFGLRWGDPRWSLPLTDLEEAIGQVSWNLFGEYEILDFLRGTAASAWSVVGSSPKGTATMMSDNGIALYAFTVDDGVYFFVLGDREICDPQWWFAHGVNDLESRADAIRSAEDVLGISDHVGARARDRSHEIATPRMTDSVRKHVHAPPEVDARAYSARDPDMRNDFVRLSHPY